MTVVPGPLKAPQPAPPSVDRWNLVQAVLLGLEPQVGNAVCHVHTLGRVGVGAGGRVRCHGTVGQVGKGTREVRSQWFYHKTLFLV